MKGRANRQTSFTLKRVDAASEILVVQEGNLLFNWQAIAHRIKLKAQTDLPKAVLGGADLSYAKLSLAFLHQANLDQAKLYRAISSSGISQDNCVTAPKEFG
ncbi:MAG: pentapeptide repeat-containing protein [Aulosira sp. DedQUE10]|nr:pentapeptide repeat-containing protein [Aulosira sp. DedQUE10]